MRAHFGPLISAGFFVGAGLGGFVDGIVLHQILQWHNMLSAVREPVTFEAVKVNMVWDGYFHAGVWVLTLIGVLLLFGAGRRGDVPMSGRVFAGSMAMGWGLFNLVEGLVNHHLLKLHHVHEYLPPDQQRMFDLGFLILGGLLALAGWLLAASGRAAHRAHT